MNQPQLDPPADESFSRRGDASGGRLTFLRFLVVGLMLHLVFEALWRAYAAAGHQLEFSFLVGGKLWRVALAGPFIVKFSSPLLRLEFPLMWAALLQIQIAVVLWWVVWVRGSNPNFRHVARRLLHVSLLAFALFLIAPVGSTVGAATFVYWILILPQHDWKGWWDLCRILMIGPTLLVPVVFYACLALRLRMRRKLGVGLAVLLSINGVALLFITWMRHHDWPWTHAVVLLGTANLTAALYLWTGIIEFGVLNHRWAQSHMDTP